MTAKAPKPPYSFYRVHPSEETVTYYHGSATITGPSKTRPGSWTEEYVTCPHRHPGWEAAQECGRRLATRTVSARNKAAMAELAAAVCERAASDMNAGWKNTEPQWLVYCKGHHTTGTHLWSTEAAALADPDWTCPWAGRDLPDPVHGGDVFARIEAGSQS